MSSTGQIVGYIAGAVIGFFTGGAGWVAMGAAIGGAIGTAIDPPKGPNIEGPRLSDLSQQTSAFGLTIPRLYGSCAIAGNVFWIENNALKEVSKTSEQGGKGGGGTEVTEYSYFATFALGLCEGPIAGVRRIWCNGKLIADLGSSDFESSLATSFVADGFRIYLGDDSQLPDPRMQAALGTANTPAYRGLAYIVFDDFALKDYGNTLAAANFKVEILMTSSSTQSRNATSYDYETPHTTPTYSPMPYYVGTDKISYVIQQWDSSAPASTYVRRYDVYPDGTLIDLGYTACSGYTPIPNHHSESGTWLYSASQVFSSGSWLGLNGWMHEAGGVWVGATDTPSPTLYAANDTVQITMTHGAEFAACTDGIYAYIVSSLGAYKYLINWDTQTFDLVSSGSSPSVATVSGSRVVLDKNSGKLVFSKEAGWPDIYIYSDDLSSYSLLATSMQPANYYNYGLCVRGNIVVQGSAYTDTSSLKKLYAEYVTINIIQNATVTLGSIISAECLKSQVLTAGDIDVTSLSDAVRGYRVASSSSIRGAIEPLRGAWPFDAIQSGYKIKFIRRGVGSSIATIDASSLDARRSGESPKFRIQQQREIDNQLPFRVEIIHIDFNRDYDTNLQHSERLNTSSVNVMKLEMPIVLTPDEAAQKAEILLFMYWMERSEFKFSMAQADALIENAEAGDILTITDGTATYELRLTSIEYRTDRIMECAARYNESSTYTSVAVGDNSAATPPERNLIQVSGPVTVELLDVPVLLDSASGPGFVTAMCGTTSYWNGGNLYRTLDGGQNWGLVGGFISPSKIGNALNNIGQPPTFSLIDKSSVISVKMFGGATLSSVTELQMLSGSNYFAYGADGRWEIIAAQTAVLQGDGSYYLYNLLRGRFGTEFAAGSHSVSDRLVLLDPNSVQMLEMSTNQIGLTYSYRGVEYGGDLFTKTDQPFAYNGVNLECLSPVYASGARHSPATNDWTITWSRRTRVGGELRDYVDASLGETSELYDVEVCSNNSYATIKRTFSNLTTPSVVYTAAMQTTDFGSVQTQLYVNVYQLSATVGRGYPLSAPVPPKHSTLGIFHLDGVVKNELDGSITALGGNASYETSGAGLKFGTHCVYTDSTGYITINCPNASALADFTFELWYQGQTNSGILESWLSLYNGELRFGYGGTLVCSGAKIGDSSTSIHLAITRKSGTTKVFWGGVQVGTTGYNTTAANLSSTVVGKNAGSISYGRFDEVRVSDVCLYTENFAPPTSQFSLPTGVY